MTQAGNRLLARIRHFGFRLMSRKFIFTRIYRQGGFGGPEAPRSGTGSTVTQTGETRKILEDVLLRYGVGVLVDAPCGDFTWMRKVSLRTVNYIGVDIVGDVIAANSQRFAAENRVFRELDIVLQPPPKGDLILSRDCFVHLSNTDIRKALANFAASGSTYLLTTTFPTLRANTDMVSGRGWRPVNLERSPFYLPAPLETHNEKCSENGGRHADKSLGLWSLAPLRNTSDGRGRT